MNRRSEFSRPHALVTGAAFGVLGEGLALPAGVITAAVLARALGLNHYGLLGVLYAVVAPCAWTSASVLGGRSAIVIISSSPAPLAAAAAVIRMSACVGLCGWLIFASCAPLIASGLHHPNAAGLLVLAGSEILLFPLARAHRDALIATGRYAGAGIAAGTYNLARLLLVVSMAGAYASVQMVVWAMILSRVAEIVVSRTSLSPPLGGRVPIGLRELVSLSSATFVYALCLQLFSRTDILMLAALKATNAALSEFTAAQSVAMAPGLIASVFGPLLLAHMRRSEEASAIRTAQRCDQLSAVIAALCLAAAGGAPSISRLLFGEHYLESGELLGWLLVGAGGAVMQSFATAQMVSRGQFRRPLAFGALLIAIAIPAQLVAIPLWHEQGAAAVTGTVAMICGLAATAALPRPRQKRMLYLAKALFCGAAGFGIAHRIGGSGLVLVDLLCGATTTVALMYVLRILDMSDLRGLLSRPRYGDVESNSAG